MAITANRSTEITLTGDEQATLVYDAVANSNSPGSVEPTALANGANTITVPAAGTVPTAVTIIPPAGNVTSLIFKGVSGDTGVRLHNTDPTTIALHASVTSFVITAGGAVNVRLAWS